jgi:hypothetical protein
MAKFDYLCVLWPCSWCVSFSKSFYGYSENNVWPLQSAVCPYSSLIYALEECILFFNASFVCQTAEYKHNRAVFNAKARQWTEQYAIQKTSAGPSTLPGTSGEAPAQAAVQDDACVKDQVVIFTCMIHSYHTNDSLLSQYTQNSVSVWMWTWTWTSNTSIV